MVDAQLIKQLRETTGAGFADCKKALEQSDSDLKKATELLKTWGIQKSAKKEGRETRQGIVESYIHANGRVGVLLTLFCETDFVAENAEFKNLAHEIAMQVASMNPKNTDELLKQDYIRDGKMKVEDLIKSVIGKIGENIRIGEFVRYEI
jgi:elongation factor Ts